MTTLSPLSGDPTDILDHPETETPDVVDNLTITITDLSPWDLQCTFSEPKYQATGTTKTKLDIDYTWNNNLKIGQYLSITIMLIDNDKYHAVFMDDDLTSKVQHPAVTAGNSVGTTMFFDARVSSDRKSATFKMKRIDIQPGKPGMYGLGIRFSKSKGSEPHMDIIYDPTVPNDGN